jgi:S-DNA-T family DNA segregation ATPase FtsK/SpoIIIE
MSIIKEVLSSSDFKDSNNRLTIALGMDITAHTVISDLVKYAPSSCCRATGTGKSVYP